jgi:hypothetical protein
MLKRGTLYEALGPDFLMKQDAAAAVANARRIKELDYEV